MRDIARSCFRFLGPYHRPAFICSPTRERRWISAGLSQMAVDCPLTALKDSRGVLRLSGQDLVPFLQGLLTNDVNKLQGPDSHLLYASLLSAQGRHLHDIFLHKAADKDTGAKVILADVDKAALPDLKRKLLMYRLRSAIDVADVSDEYGVWVQTNHEVLQSEEASSWHVDPRLQALGLRAVLHHQQVPQDSAGLPSDEKSFKRLRLSHGVPEGDTEIPHGQAMPLEYNLDALNAISYTKGCYVGQELIARTHHKGVVRKRLMPFTTSGTADRTAEAPASGSAILDNDDGKEIGAVRAAERDLGIAHVRLKPVLSALESSHTLQVGDTPIFLQRPNWWPSSWGKEE